MDQGLLEIVLGVAAGIACAGLGWAGHGFLGRRALRRQQRFFGLPRGAECALVVDEDADPQAAEQPFVAKHDVMALLALSALVSECGANADLVPQDTEQRGFGHRTEFCIGDPSEHRRLAAHLASLLPGVAVDAPGKQGGAFRVGGKTYTTEPGSVEYALLARVTAGEEGRPVFLAGGHGGVAGEAAVRYLTRHHRKLARRHGYDGAFCLLLKVVNSQAYGPDVVELVADVTKQASSAPTGSKAIGSKVTGSKTIGSKP